MYACVYVGVKCFVRVYVLAMYGCVHVGARMSGCIHVRVCTCMDVFCMNVWLHRRMGVFVQVLMYVCVSVRVHVCFHVYMHRYAWMYRCVCVHVWM